MACVVITLPSNVVLTFAIPNGGQIVPIVIRECRCGCKSWFTPIESSQVYAKPEHQVSDANEKRRKTPRRQA
jgi:hypothetical protein